MEEDEILESMKKTKYWRYMLSREKEIEQDLAKFNRDFLAFLESSTDEMALVLKCHLIVEHYLDQYLSAAFPTIESVDKLNLRFSAKIEMINTPTLVFGYYYEALKQFNSLRNKFVHNLEYKVRKQDIGRIAHIMDAWNDALGSPRTEGMLLIRQYTMWICSSFFSIRNTIHEEAKDLGVAGYLRWLDEMNQPVV